MSSFFFLVHMAAWALSLSEAIRGGDRGWRNLFVALAGLNGGAAVLWLVEVCRG